ncbi:TEF transcription factor, PAR bZIP family member a isoform X2 [Narcine bancroftii]|uniref:TEF transcription factor, PAR bZIP family member a isoform X2 n=1 Tax=Narcine bancroftii TaxID=1343680 RepID=UPI003831AFF6
MHRKSPQAPEDRCDATMLSSWPVVLKSLIENPPQQLLDHEGKDEDKDKDVDVATGSTIVASASLMPTIWDKTIPYDGETFHLELMDVDDFLLENGIAGSPSHLNLQDALGSSLLSVEELEDKELAPALPSPGCRSLMYSSVNSDDSDGSQTECNSPSPVDPEAIDVLDDRYWTRRKKNNLAAKRSRDARRLKENQITVRAAFLERENLALRQEVAELRKEVGHYKNIISKYRAKYRTL